MLLSRISRIETLEFHTRAKTRQELDIIKMIMKATDVDEFALTGLDNFTQLTALAIII